MEKSIATLKDSIANLNMLGKALRVLQEAGLFLEGLNWAVNSKEFRQRLVDFWVSGCHTPNQQEIIARKVMKGRVIGPGEIAKYFHYLLPPDWLYTHYEPNISEIPFKRETLNKYRHSHILVLVPRISILWMIEKYQEFFDLGFEWENASCLRDDVDPGWHLIRSDILPDSYGKSLDEKFRLLSKANEVISHPARITFLTLIWHMKTGKWLFYEKGQSQNSSGTYFSIHTPDTIRLRYETLSYCGIFSEVLPDGKIHCS